jgi:hypothetical protein
VRRTAITRRHRSLSLMALLATLAMLFAGPFVPAGAAPNGPGDEGGSKTLREVLEDAAKGHIEAKNKLEKSKKRQKQLEKELKAANKELGRLTEEVALLANQSYRIGRLTPVGMLLNSASPETFLERASGLEVIAQRDARKLQQLAEAMDEVTRAKAAIDKEVTEQQKQVAVMARKRQDAERALAAVGGAATGGYVSATSPAAQPAPRNPDGSWPPESCTVDDPTTSGCITPRTLHALNESKAAGFTRYTSCYRSYNDGGEHPKGRACDFSAATGGFQNVHASGDDRTYGNNLAAFLVRNADRLGVLYVIWYRQIWSPATGWRAYYGGGGPAAEHTNHVHLSVI